MRNPFVGSCYAQYRVLILGESNWGTGLDDSSYVIHWLDHPNFTMNPDCPICLSVGGPHYKRDPLFDALTKMMLGGNKPPTDAERRTLWSRIAFGNFILREMAERVTDRPLEAEWGAAALALRKDLASLKPCVCLVLDNPRGELLSHASPVLEANGVKTVRLSHPTMIPAPSLDARREAWDRCVQEANQLG